MTREVCEYRLSLRGRPVGSYRMTTLVKHDMVFLDAQLNLQGPLGRKNIEQYSNIERDSLTSLQFSEHYRSGSETRHFEVVFDQEEGLVTARRGAKDEASIPYIQPYRDPLSIFYELRQTGSERLRLPLIGKTVVLEQVSEVTLETPTGNHPALVYSCQPGNNYIYLEDSKHTKNGQRTILKLSQQLDGQVLEATLVKVSYEAERRQPERRHNKRHRAESSRSSQRTSQRSSQRSSQRNRSRGQQRDNRTSDGDNTYSDEQTTQSSSPRKNTRQRNPKRKRQRNQQKQSSSSDTQNTKESTSENKSSQPKKRNNSRRRRSNQRGNAKRRGKSRPAKSNDKGTS